MDRTDIQAIKWYLQAAGAWSQKSLGQHFLIDKAVLETIVQTAGLENSDTVVEIGPGIGVLSEQLLAKAKRVIAFELDARLAALLKKDLPALELVEGDVLRMAPEYLQGIGEYKLVANIPYQITTPLIRLFVEGDGVPKPVSLTLLVQREVGERLAAKPGKGERGYLSVLCQYYADIQYVRTVPAAAFWPPPQVESAVIHLQIKTDRLFSSDKEREFLRFIRMAFAQKRKQLKNVLAGIRGEEVGAVAAWMARAGVTEKARAHELSLEEWRSLYIQE